MKRNTVTAIIIAAAMALPALSAAQPGPGPGYGAGKGTGMGPGMGAGPGKGMMQHNWSRERMYGSPMMTLEERQAHQQQMWNAKTATERQKIRDEHRKQMVERAKQQNFRIDQNQDDAFSVPAIPK